MLAELYPEFAVDHFLEDIPEDDMDEDDFLVQADEQTLDEQTLPQDVEQADS